MCIHICRHGLFVVSLCKGSGLVALVHLVFEETRIQQNGFYSDILVIFGDSICVPYYNPVCTSTSFKFMWSATLFLWSQTQTDDSCIWIWIWIRISHIVCVSWDNLFHKILYLTQILKSKTNFFAMVKMYVPVSKHFKLGGIPSHQKFGFFFCLSNLYTLHFDASS